jgi:acetate kinase
MSDARATPAGGAARAKGLAMDDGARILAVNTGSSSLKAAVYRPAAPGSPDQSVLVERIGSDDAHIRVTDRTGRVAERNAPVRDIEAALTVLVEALDAADPGHHLRAIGHRLVHGGRHFDRPAAITPETLRALDDLARLAPEHMPQALAAVRFFARRAPAVPQVACFDTAFHRTLPRVAQLIPLPQRYRDAGFVRFGFHGLSYESSLAALRGMNAANGRIVILHLGNGASMAAVRDGACVDTTMGYTPTSGLVMGTRCGDIDSGVLVELLTTHGLTPDALNDLLNKESGLLGVSGTSADMRDLLAAEATDANAADAIALFCYRAQKYLGAFASVLGGLDTVVFTGGIGEKSAAIRARICTGQAHLGIALDAGANAAADGAAAAVVSAPAARVAVRVIRADEEAVIARHVLEHLRQHGRAPARAAAVAD